MRHVVSYTRKVGRPENNRQTFATTIRARVALRSSRHQAGIVTNLKNGLHSMTNRLLIKAKVTQYRTQVITSSRKGEAFIKLVPYRIRLILYEELSKKV